MPSMHGGNPGPFSINATQWANGSEDVVSCAYRFRHNQAFLDSGGYVANGGNSTNSPKTVIWFEGGTCSNNEFTMVNSSFNTNIASYTDCGRGHVGLYLPSNNDKQPDGNTSCPRTSGSNPGVPCLRWETDIWFTIVMECSNLLGPGNEVVDIFVYPEAPHTYSGQWWHTLHMEHNGPNDVQGRTPVTSLRACRFTIYATGKNASIAHDPWYGWYQDLCIAPYSLRGLYGIPY